MANTYLTRTQGTPTNNKIFTVSCWFKASQVANEMKLIYSDDNSTNNYTYIHFSDTSGRIRFQNRNSGSNNTELIWENHIRDFSAYYHLVMAVDSTQSTASNRVKFYLNGVQQTTLDSSANTYPPVNQSFTLNSGGYGVDIGSSNTSSYFQGSMTHFHFVDGTAYPASTFGETDSVSGIWKPKTAPSVTYGTNGFFLKFENSGAMGTDSSGNTNTFAVGGGTLTQNVDTPSNNFATNNPICNIAGRWTMTNANNTIQHANSGAWTAMMSSILPSVGKYYMEAKITGGASRTMFGVMSADTNIMSYETNLTTICLYYNLSGGEFQQSGSTTSGNNYGTFADNDIAGIALDCTNNKISIYKNGTALVTDHTIPATVDGFIGFGFTSDSNSTIYQCNYGNGFFGTTAVTTNSGAGYQDADGNGKMNYTVPSGYKILCTKGINSF